MARRNVIDDHERRDEIIEAIRVGNESHAEIASRFDLTKSSVQRYAKKLQKEEVLEAIKSDAAAESVPAERAGREVHPRSMLDQLQQMQEELQIIRETYQSKPMVWMTAIDKGIKVISTYVEIAREYREQQAFNIEHHPEFQRFKNAIITVLQRHPGLMEEFERELEEGERVDGREPGA